MNKIDDWRERCEKHPDHNGIVTHAMIAARMQEEIDVLRSCLFDMQNAAQALLKERDMLWVLATKHCQIDHPDWKKIKRMAKTTPNNQGKPRAEAGEARCSESA